MKGAVPFPESGLGEGDTSGDKAVRAIKLMTQRAIELAVLDEAGAITGERPLEQIADSSGYAVGGSALQMQADLGSFKVLAVHSKGLTPAQQAWAPLSREGYAQLEVRRAVKKQLGPIKSICWTDHANWTRQQTLEQVEPKHLRWLSEILADGSELRSLAGRSARLGDGYSRNPPERDQLLEQRTKDLEGLIGQLRGFSLEEYLSDVSEKVALPWSVGDGVLPEPEEGRSAGNDQVAAVAGELGVLNRSLRNNMFAAGVSSEIRVLYVPDYVARNDRWIQTKELSKLFRTIFPEAEVKVALAEPPFEDPEGNALHFERQGKQHLTGKKLVNATRVDLLTSVAALLREIAKHMPNFVVGAGQGAIVCLAAASPVVVESVLLARNVHITEAHKVASAWAQVKLMFGANPRIGKSKPGGQLLKEACPEWFTPHVLECLPRLGMVEKYVPVREEIEELLSCAGVMQVNSLESVMWSSWLERDSKELWEHEGQCACGRRTRLFGQCMRCIEAEHAEEVQRRADQGVEEEDQNVERRFELEGGPDVTAKIEPLIERDPVTGREELSGTAEKWLNEHLKRRKEKVEELKEESELAVGADLRSDWFKSQRSDDKLMSVIQKCLKRTEETNKFRLAEDGLLERLLERDGQNGELWVPVVPDGKAHSMMSWKEFCCRQVHTGIMGAHRSGAKMLAILRKACWWDDMESDLEKYADRCLVCIRNRRRPVKQLAVPVKPSWLECWEEIAVDFEGPMHPEDHQGNRFILTYMCCVSGGIMLEPCKALSQVEVRRAFAKLMFRSRTLPKMMRSDRGQEFRSTLLKEYCALLGVRQKFSGPLRPCEMGRTERIHQEMQKVLGLLVHDVCRSRPHEWMELLGVVEYILDTTPGPSGFAPRDFERGWSLASPLERELIGKETLEFEPVEEATKKLFKAYREIRVKVLGWQAASAAQRADRANRFRKVKVVEIGDLVVYRDPRLRSGGRTPWRKQLSEPMRITAKQGNRVELEPVVADLTQGRPRTLKDVHVEDLLLVPPDAAATTPIRPAHVELPVGQDDPGSVRSPGLMVEQREDPDAGAAGVVPERANRRTKKGKLASLRIGSYVAYAIESIKANVPANKHLKRGRVGKILQIRPVEQVLLVHRYTPIADGRLRVRWKEMYLSEATKEETLIPSSHPVQEEVPLQRIITKIHLNSGVMSHAAARQIDASGYRVDERRSEALQREVDADRRIEIADVGAVQEMVAMMTESPAHVADRPGDHSKVFVDRSQVALPDDLEAKLKETHRKAEAKWDALSLAKDWDQVCSDLSSFRFSGEELAADPRRNSEYKEKVVSGLGFSDADREKKTWLNREEFSACQEVLRRKAAGFWVPGTPRTTIRHVQHDTIPTGPPVKTPPHRLAPEAAEWIDQKIEEEVARGQLVRGNSPWGSPPFPTKAVEAAHKRARKRRIVVDYRRVNARVLRNSYYSRKSSEVIAEASGSAYLTLLDAVTGFNQVENTERAKQVLALVSRGGQFLPTCLTFGPQNGPEDFAFVVDRIYAPGRHRRLRLMKEWLPYVDDLTIRTGRVLDGVIYKDSEVTARVREAVSVANVSEQDIGEALKACGFSSKGLSKEKSKTEPDRDQRPELRSEEKVAAVRAEGVGRRVPPRLSKGKVTGVMGKEKEDPLETPFLGSLRTPEALEVCLAAASACWEVQGRNGPLHDRSRLSVRADAPEWGFGPARSVGNWSGPRSPRKASTGSEDGESEECGRQPPPTKKMAGKVKEKEEEGEPSAETVRLSHRLTALLRHGKVHGKRMAVKGKC